MFFHRQLEYNIQLWQIAPWQGICVIPPGYKHDINIRLCDGLLLEDFPHQDSRLGIQKVFPRISNFESKKLCKLCKVFWIQDFRDLSIILNLHIYISLSLSLCYPAIPQLFFSAKLLPVVPHKAVAEVSKIGNLGWLLWLRDGRAKPLMDRKVAGVVFFGAVALVASNGCSGHLTTTAGCSVV